MKNKKQYSFRKNIIKKVLGISLKIDDTIQGLREEIIVLLIRFTILILALGLVIYSIIARNYIQLAIFLLITLNAILSYIGQIKKYKMTKALTQLKNLRVNNEI